MHLVTLIFCIIATATSAGNSQIDLLSQGASNTLFNKDVAFLEHKIELQQELPLQRNEIQPIFLVDGRVAIIKPRACPKNLVIQGGGAKGVCLPAFLKTLDEGAPFLKSVNEVAGTSAGATMAFLLAAGVSPQEIDHYVSNVNLLDQLKGEVLKGLKFGSCSKLR